MKLIRIFSFLASVFISSLAQAQVGHLNLQNKLAVDGYDVVAYFKQGKPVKGSKEFAVSADGATYYFSSLQNKELFKANAKQYQPQYGGWCAYAMGATGEKVEIDPETFKISNGKLFLFYHSWTNNTLTKWNKNETALHKAADDSWAKLIVQKP